MHRGLRLHRFGRRIASYGAGLLMTLIWPAGGVNGGEQRDQEARMLEPGQPIKRELTGGQIHSYRLTLTAGQYLRVLINQRGIDVVTALFGPDGQKVSETDTSSGHYGLESISAVAAASGTYRLETWPSNKKASPGKYEIWIDQLREARPPDNQRVAAERVLVQAEQMMTREEADFRQKAAKYEEALVLLRAAPEPLVEAQALQGLGRIHNVLGDKQEALDCYLRALPLRSAAGDRRGEGTTLNSIGTAYIGLGEFQKALDYLERALPIRREFGDLRGEGVTLNNIAFLHLHLGDVEQALDYERQALPIRRAAGDKEGEFQTLNGFAAVYKKLGDHQAALDYYNQALQLARTIENRLGTSSTLRQMAIIHELSGDYRKALDYHQQALSQFRVEGTRLNQGSSLIAIGNLQSLLGETEKAGDTFNQVLLLCRQLQSRSGEAAALYGLTRLNRDLGHLTEARAQIEAALGLVESLRTKIDVEDLRASYLADLQSYYELNIDVLMKLHALDPTQGYAGAALQGCERARARTLLETLAEARADIRQGVDPGLLGSERSLQQRLESRVERLIRLLGGRHTAEQAEAAQREIEALRTEYLQVRAQIHTTSPRYAALTQPRPLDLGEIRQQVLDPDTLLLEYALGKERSYLWAVTATSLASFELPRRAEIEQAARRSSDLLTARNKVIAFETADERRARITRADAEYAEAAAALSQVLLGPVAAQLGPAGRKRLLIVADGALQYLPFGALPCPGVRDRAADQRPLIVDHEIVSLPSASTLAVIRRELTGRRPAPRSLAVLADPVFNAADERLVGSGARAPTRVASPHRESEVTRAARGFGLEAEGLRLPRLPFTRKEARAILALAPAGARKEALDFAASQATATGPDLARYRYLHFATHGFLNSAHPELSGIVLSLVDERGREQDGFLRASEIFNLNLPAELVVLSGCRTGLGKEIRGEGLVGLTRGFMYAGAARVMVSLWDVHDAATAELMTRFYRGVLGQQRLAPAAALRAAQVSMWKERRWQAPYYWAAFVLQGEPK